VVVTEKKYVNNGSSALNPQKKPFREGNNELQRKDKEELRKAKQVKLKKRAMIMCSIGFIFLAGFTVIYRYSMIYSMQIQLESNNANIDNIIKNNENLQLQLVQYNKLESLEDEASKLNMVTPEKNSSVSLDYDKQTLKLANNTSTQSKENIFSKLLDMIKK
jgi:cell division protein FtsL